MRRCGDTDNIRNELVIFDTKNINDYPDGMVYRALRANCTAPMHKIYFGQIADLFLHKNKDYNHDSIPYDPFYDKYYGKQMFPFPNTKRYDIMDKNQVKKNFSYIKNDCIQYIYDWGEEWCWNIYIIDKKQNKMSNNNYKSLSRFIDGKCIIPPNDISGMEGFKWSLEKCHYDPYALKMEIGDIKKPNDIYQWMGETLERYYDFGCLMGQNNPRIRQMLILHFKEHQNVDYKIRKKIINQLKSGRPFWFPYREMPEIQSHLNRLNKACHKRWNSKIKSYERKNREYKCAHCHGHDCKLKACKGCQSVRYCSTKCQKRHWSMHKINCV